MQDGVSEFSLQYALTPQLTRLTGFSQAFYREKLYESVLGFKDLEDFMKNFWEAWALSKGL